MYNNKVLMNTLTKSLYLNGLQCPKLLWIMCHERERIPETDASTQHLFDQGKVIGELAKTLFKQGMEINAEYWNIADSNQKSIEACKLRKPLFEAGFLVNRVYARVDVLVPARRHGWDIVEVKSSTSVKEENIKDVSFQKYCYETAGLKIRKCFLLYVNNKYVRKGEITAENLFVKEDITSLVEAESDNIEERIDEMLKIMNSRRCPAAKVGPHCVNPYECALNEYCFGDIPLTSVLNLYHGGERRYELYNSGVKKMEDIPEKYKLNERQLIQRECAMSGKPCIRGEKIKGFLKNLKYPLAFLDFETYSTAIPLYDGLSPWQNIPFQFSLHVIEKPGEKAKHYSFIAEGSGDPRKTFLDELMKVLGTKGSIVIYNKSFEIGILNKLAENFPAYRKWVDSIVERIVDLLEPFRNFYYYNNKQEGSASLKAVLPVLTGKSYDDIDISEGGNASLQYLYITHGSADGKKASAEETKEVRKALEEYCGLDSEGMILLLAKLEELSK
jgi:CRISPR/Cas system-associated exonuclease Cas4 (RecB family)